MYTGTIGVHECNSDVKGCSLSFVFSCEESGEYACAPKVSDADVSHAPLVEVPDKRAEGSPVGCEGYEGPNLCDTND